MHGAHVDHAEAKESGRNQTRYHKLGVDASFALLVCDSELLTKFSAL